MASSSAGLTEKRSGHSHRSPIGPLAASGRRRSEAAKSPGVLAIYTPFHSLKLYYGLTQAEGANSGEIDPPLQNNKISYYGQIVALVVAESFEQARDAAALVKVDYTPERPVTTWETGMKNAFPPVAVDG